jgi:hypothetical protein
MPKKTPRDSPQGESGKLCFCWQARLATDLRSLGPNARLWNTWFVYTCEYPYPAGATSRCIRQRPKNYVFT